MSLMEEIRECRCSNLNKPGVSLIFGIVVSSIAASLLLIANCAHTWAVRLEIVLITEEDLLDTIYPNRTQPKDIQISVPYEVPSLNFADGVMDPYLGGDYNPRGYGTDYNDYNDVRVAPVLQKNRTVIGEVEERNGTYEGSANRTGAGHPKSKRSIIRDPVMVQYTICLYRTCVKMDSHIVNLTQECMSVFSSFSPQHSPLLLTIHPALLPATTSLIASTRSACCIVITGFVILFLAIALSIRTFFVNEVHKNLFEPHVPEPTQSSRNLQNMPDEQEETTGEKSLTMCSEKNLRTHFMPIASALFAVSGITMGGGIFQFCSAATEKPAIPMHQMTYSFTGVQPSSALEWPVLIVANSVIACFFAALATGYAFFLTWDKHIVGIFAKEESKDNLLMYDSIESSRSNLCERCRAPECSGVQNDRFAVVRPHRCCHIDYCCSNANTNFGGSQAGSSSSSSAGCNYADYNFKKFVNNSDMKRNCARCAYDHSCRVIRENTVYNTTKSPAMERHFNINGTEITNTENTVDIGGHNIRDGIAHKPSDFLQHLQHHHAIKNQYITHTNSQRPTSIGDPLRVCNDPICQREQIRYQIQYPKVLERPNSTDPALIHGYTGQAKAAQQNEFRTHSWTERRTNLPNLVPATARNKELQRGASFDETEHLYSNYYPEKITDNGFPTTSLKFPLVCSNISNSTKCNCCDDSKSFSGKSSYDYFPQIPKENISSSSALNFSNTRQKSWRYPSNFPHNISSSLSYSTLPAKFSNSRDSFPIENVNTKYSSLGRREYRSCLNINDDVQSMNMFHPYKRSHCGKSWKNSSVPSLKARLSDSEDFDGRKTVKTVTFMTPDDEIDDDNDDEADIDEDDDYYLRKSVRSITSGFKQSQRQDLAGPDGSSENSEVYDGPRSMFR